jgi:hypothetical protein
MAAVIFVAAALAPRAALAARVATVESDEVDVRDGPGTNAKVIDKLKKGTQIAVSNQPVSGFYKTRTGLGVVGFVDANSVVVAAPAAPASAEGAEPSLPGDTPPSEPGAPRSRRDRAEAYSMRIKALGGYNFFSVKDVNLLLNSDSLLRFGYSFGAEAQVFLSPLFSITARGERIQCGAFARDSAQSHVYQIDTGAWTAMGGVEVTLARTGKVSAHIGVLGGVGLSSTITATDLSAAAPNVTTMSSLGYAGIAKLDAHVQATGALGFFVEGGYRLQKTPAMQPSDSPNGSQIFKDQTTGVYVPVTLDYSGPFAGAGLSVSF